MVSSPNKVVFPKRFFVVTYYVWEMFLRFGQSVKRMLWKRIGLGNIFNETSCIMFIRGSGRCGPRCWRHSCHSGAGYSGVQCLNPIKFAIVSLLTPGHDTGTRPGVSLPPTTTNSQGQRWTRQTHE